MKNNLIETMNQQLKALIPGSVYLISVIALIVLLKPQGFYTIVPMLVILNIIRQLHDVFHFKKFIKNVISSSIIISILYLIMFQSLRYGFVGFALYIVALSCWVMFGSSNKRNSYLNGLRNIESAIFGKSLDKDNWVEEKPTINIKLTRGKK